MGIKRHSKNLFDMEYVYKKLFPSNPQPTKDGDTYTLDALSSWGETYFYFDEPKTITVSGIINDPNRTEQGLVFYNDTTELGSFTGTTRTFENVTKFRFKYFGYGKCYWSNIQIEEGTEATPYQPMMVEAENIVRTTRNLFDKEVPISGNFLSSTGTIVNNAYSTGWGISNYYKVGTECIISGITEGNSPCICAYDKQKNFIKGVSYSNNHEVRISDPNMEYVRISVRMSNSFINSLQLELGTEATPYVPHTVSATKVVRTTRNLFDKNACTLNKSFNKDKIVNLKGWFVSGLIKVKPQKTYIVSNNNGRRLHFFNSEKQLVSYPKPTKPLFTVPDDASYVQICGRIDYLDIIQLELGTEATPYVPHTITIWENNET